MKRKIIKQGHNTLTITLPSKWAKRFNVCAGCEIDLIERANGLFIATTKINDSKKTAIEVDGMDIPTIWKHLMSVYREGYDEVLIKFSPNLKLENPYKFFTKHSFDRKYQSQRKDDVSYEVLSKFIDRFIGWEVVEHGEDFLLVREMGELTTREFDSSLRRIFLILEQMSEETLKAVKENKTSILKHMHDVDISLDKFMDYCIRVLNKTGSKDPQQSSLIFSSLFILEMLGDEFKNIANHLLNDFPDSNFKNITVIAEYVKEEIDLYREIFFKFDRLKVGEISEIDQEIYFMFDKIYGKSSEAEKEIFNHLRRIARYINGLVELRIEMEF